MGISDSSFAYMVKSIPQLRLGRSCATLGKQAVLIGPERALGLVAEAGLIGRGARDEFLFPADHPFAATYAAGGDVIRDSEQAGMITDVALMNLLGFADVYSIDVSAFEGANILMDLNDPGAAERFGRKFHFILDGGALEHIFHLPNALKNVFDLLETGGCVLHLSPVNNYVDHGFYQFSPTLYEDYYQANRFTILDRTIFQVDQLNVNAQYFMDPYIPGSLEGKCFGGLDNVGHSIAFLARKDPASTCGVIPQQSFYTQAVA